MDKKSFIAPVIILLVAAMLILTYTYKEREIQNLKVNHENEADDLVNQINSLNKKISSLEYNTSEMESEISQLIDAKNDLQNSFNSTSEQLKLLKQGDKYTLHDPTYSEAWSFIKSDDTNTYEYVEGTFVCEDFASITNSNAEDSGIRCGVVHITFENKAHALIGFDTIDKGMLYIEPQYDEIVENLEIGKEYYTECIVPNEGYYYEDDPDDTIQKIVEYW